MMRSRYVPFCAAFTLAAGVTLAAGGQPREPTVTSDSPEYCGVLMQRISGMVRGASMPREAALLSSEGERMCVHGHTRGGIMRLRRAIEIISHPEE